jgi:hypothetical protein
MDTRATQGGGVGQYVPLSPPLLILDPAAAPPALPLPAPREFVTGFRKRKLQRKEDAKKKAKDRARQQVLEERKEVRW